MGITPTRVVSFVWGLAEAVFFFLIPDIWLSRLVLMNRNEAYLNCAIASFAALVGGCFMYFVSVSHFAEVKELLAFVPAVSASMIDKVGVQIEQEGLLRALLTGMITGIPYKLFASWSGFLGLPLIVFIAASVTMRALRFFTVVALFDLVSSVMRKKLSIHQIYVIHGFVWLAVYTFYFCKFGI